MKTANSSIRLCLALVAGLFASASLKAQTLNYLNYNVIVFNDLNTTSHVDGRTFVGHDFTGTGSADLGIHLDGSVSALDRSFVVGNNIFAGGTMSLQRGSLYIDGTNGRTPPQFNFNGGGSQVADHQIDPSTASIFDYSVAQSQALRNMTADSFVTLPSGGQNGPIKFVADGGADGVAVFNIMGSDIFSNNLGQQIELSATGITTSVVINVGGTSVNWSAASNMVSKFTEDHWQGHTIWNFYEATSVNLGNHQFNGAILAPYASVNAGGNIDGLVVAQNLTTNSEVHLPGNGNAYDGYLAAVPEPGSAWLVLAIGGFVLIARNRRLLV